MSNWSLALDKEGKYEAAVLLAEIPARTTLEIGPESPRRAALAAP
jgi:hypothetical protein